MPEYRNNDNLKSGSIPYDNRSNHNNSDSDTGFFSFRLQIASRYGQDPEQNRVDADLYSLKFQNLKNIRSN